MNEQWQMYEDASPNYTLGSDIVEPPPDGWEAVTCWKPFASAGKCMVLWRRKLRRIVTVGPDGKETTKEQP